MFSTPVEAPIEEENLLISIASRVPGSLAKRIGDEAALRGLTVSKYSATLLIDAFEDRDSSQQQIELLLKEKRLISEESAKKDVLLHQTQQKLKDSESRLQMAEATCAPYQDLLAALSKNDTILKKLYAQYGTTAFGKEWLEKEGFMAHLLVARVREQGQFYQVIFNYGYTLLPSGLIQIKQMNSSTLLYI